MSSGFFDMHLSLGKNAIPLLDIAQPKATAFFHGLFFLQIILDYQITNFFKHLYV